MAPLPDRMRYHVAGTTVLLAGMVGGLVVGFWDGLFAAVRAGRGGVGVLASVALVAAVDLLVGALLAGISWWCRASRWGRKIGSARWPSTPPGSLRPGRRRPPPPRRSPRPGCATTASWPPGRGRWSPLVPPRWGRWSARPSPGSAGAARPRGANRRRARLGLARGAGPHARGRAVDRPAGAACCWARSSSCWSGARAPRSSPSVRLTRMVARRRGRRPAAGGAGPGLDPGAPV